MFALYYFTFSMILIITCQIDKMKVLKSSLLSLITTFTVLNISMHGIIYNDMYTSGRRCFEILTIYWIIDLISIFTIQQLDMIFHHLFCIIASINALYRKVYLDLVPYIMIVEVSTIFYHFKLIMDKMGKKETTLYKVNGFMFWLSFLICRIIAIPLIVFFNYHVIHDVRSTIEIGIFAGLLWILSLYWFYKMSLYIKKTWFGAKRIKKTE